MAEYSIRSTTSDRKPSNFLPMETGYELILEEVNKFRSITKKLYPKISKAQAEVIQKCEASLSQYYSNYVLLSSDILIYNTLIANESGSNVEEKWNTVNTSRERMIKDCNL
jgi:hypothetical protein